MKQSILLTYFHEFFIGFKVSNLGCCGTGLIEVTALCNNYTAAVCPVRSDYVFWDSFHPTETAYRIIVAKLLDRYLSRIV